MGSIQLQFFTGQAPDEHAVDAPAGVFVSVDGAAGFSDSDAFLRSADG
jgi:hypothetical protein